MHRSKRQRTGDDLRLAENVHGAHAEVHRKGAAEGDDAQAAVGVDALDHHGDLVLMRHDAGGQALGLVARRPGRTDAADEVVRRILPDLVAAAFELAPADVSNFSFLPGGTARQQQFFQ